MLTEAFRVLMTNAVQAIREKGRGEKVQGGELRVESCLEKGDNNSVVEVLVCDTGVGIKPQDLRNIFDIKWSTNGGKEAGFGLFWTKDYIEGLGGSVEVESVWQKGTTFRVRLPAVGEQADVL
jgi:signal transduction histidine kinase